MALRHAVVLCICLAPLWRTFLQLRPPTRVVSRAAVAAGQQPGENVWQQRLDQMILPAARVVSAGGKQGSAFVISNSNGTYAITCHHVIRDCIKQNDRWDPVKKSSGKVEQLLPVSVETFRYDQHGRHLQTVTTSADIVAYCIYGDEWTFEGDLALLKLKVPLEGSTAAALITEEDFDHDVRPLDEVVMVGCPDASEVPLPTTGHVASLSEVRAGIGLMLSQVFGNPGSSGSAVYRFSAQRNRYEVIALHSLTDGRGALTALGRGNFLRLAVQAPEIHKFLRSHQLSHLVQPAASTKTAAATKTKARATKSGTQGTKTAVKKSKAKKVTKVSAETV